MEILELRRGPKDKQQSRQPLRLLISPHAFEVRFRIGV